MPPTYIPKDFADVRRMLIEEKTIITCNSPGERRVVMEALIADGLIFNDNSMSYLTYNQDSLDYPNPGSDGNVGKELCCYRRNPSTVDYAIPYSDFVAVLEDTHHIEDVSDDDFIRGLSMLGMC